MARAAPCVLWNRPYLLLLGYLFNLIRVRAAPVACLTADSSYHTLVVTIEFKVFFIDFSRHSIHMAGHVFFWFGVAGEVEVMRSAVGGGGMTKITFNAQGGLPAVHGAIQLVVSDILRQNLQISLRRLLVFSRTDC